MPKISREGPSPCPIRALSDLETSSRVAGKQKNLNEGSRANAELSARALALASGVMRLLLGCGEVSVLPRGSRLRSEAFGKKMFALAVGSSGSRAAAEGQKEAKQPWKQGACTNSGFGGVSGLVIFGRYTRNYQIRPGLLARVHRSNSRTPIVYLESPHVIAQRSDLCAQSPTKHGLCTSCIGPCSRQWSLAQAFGLQPCSQSPCFAAACIADERNVFTKSF